MCRVLIRWLAVAVLLGVYLPAQGQTVVPRHNYGALLEPDDVLMHGAGQSVEDFNDYWNAMPADQKPVVYMHYIGLSNLRADWADDLKATLRTYPDHFVLPQIGLSMTRDGNPNAHYEHLVAEGVYDDRIADLIEGFRRLATPAYLRIGYEFNGRVWNGYEPETYKAAFIRITEKLRAADLEVATVWCGAMDGDHDFFAFYPGDEYVDWFGLDLFDFNHFSHPDAHAFLDSAHVHQKPVMIGETTPRRVGVRDGEADWIRWFVPFFEYMHTRPEVKQFGYINWNWPVWSTRLGINWADWGDARLQVNEEVLSRYVEATSAPEYLHATDEFTFRQRLGYDDITPPPAPSDIRRTGSDRSAAFAWNAVFDPSGLARYLIYKDDVLVDYTLNTAFFDADIPVGTTTYQVQAIDRAGNAGPHSEPLTVEILQLERIRNGNFEKGFNHWRFDVFNNLNRANFTTEFDSLLTATTAGRVDVQRSTNTDWHVQLRQFIPFKSGNTYRIVFQARASKAVTLPVIFQQSTDPFSIYHRRDMRVGTNAKTFGFEFMADTTDAIAFSFFLGDIGTASIWFDDVSVVELDPSIVSTEATLVPPNFDLTVYPNPATTQSTVAYSLKAPGHVHLEAYDVLGRRVRVLHEGVQPAGRHRIPVTFDGLAGGLYLVRIQTANGHIGSLPVAVVE